MKGLSVSELDKIVAALKPLVGTRLQEVQSSESDLMLGFYSENGILWLWMDLNAIRPSMLPWVELPLRVPSRKTPLNLFMRAHFVGKTLISCERVLTQGRVVLLRFGPQEDVSEIEIRLVPHARNIIARSQNKQIAWQKPTELTEGKYEDELGAVRSLDELRAQWKSSREGKGGAKNLKDVKLRLQDEIQRKRKAIGKVQEELQRKKSLPWRQIGDWLKEHQSMDVPKEWQPFIDKRRKLSWNIEEVYSRAREIEAKLYGTEKRLSLLYDEISALEAKINKPIPLQVEEKKTKQPLQDIGAQGRTLRISDELTLISGKTATDNLKLLRKARAWDYWLHLRDVPSSHAILFRNKNTKVGDNVVQQAVEWYVKQHLGPKYRQHAGEKFHVLMAECRYVRPIKGDKIGRVTFHNERVITHLVPST